MRLARDWIVHVLLACSAVACATRSLPASEPPTSAASPDAVEAAPHVVTQALNEDPPLPGPQSDAWLGLRAPAEPGGEHEHQHSPATPASTAPQHQHGAAPGTPGGNGAAPSGVRYVCPMHPEVVSSEPGRCPRCGMALVRRP